MLLGRVCRAGAEEYDEPGMRADLSNLVGSACIQCMQLFMNREMCAKESAQTTSTERYRMVPDCQAVKKKWTKCLDRIALSEPQVRFSLSPSADRCN